MNEWTKQFASVLSTRGTPVKSTIALVGVLCIVLFFTSGYALWGDAFLGNTTVHRAYDYREVAAVYDSVDIKLTYGEMFFINGTDSSHIFAHTFFDTTWYQGSKDEINAELVWSSFPCDEDTEISLWKAASYCLADTNATNLCFPDTVAWVLRLLNAENGAVLGTLDSTVLYRTMSGRDFPVAYGFSGNAVWEHRNWRVSDYWPTGSSVDSVYLAAEVTAFSGNNDNFFISDAFTINRKFSNHTGFAKRTPISGSDNVVHGSVYNISIYPNPLLAGQSLTVTLEARKEFTGRLCIINTLGEVIHTFHSGHFSAGSASYSYRPGDAMPAASYWVILADNGNLIVEKDELKYMK